MKRKIFTALRQGAAGLALPQAASTAGTAGPQFIDRLGTTIDLPMVTRWSARGVDVRD